MMKTTLHISSHEVKLVAGNSTAVKSWMSKRLEPGLVEDSHVIEPERVGSLIAEMFDNQGLSRSHVTVSISGLPYTYRILDLPVLKEDQVEEAIMRSLQDEMAISIEELYVSWARLVEKPEGVDYFILGADRELVDSVIATMKAADIRDWALDLVPFAVARVAAAPDAIVVCLDDEQMDIVLTSRGYIREMHSTVVDYTRENTGEYIEQFANELMKLISFLQKNMEEGVDLSQFPIIVTGELVAHAYGEPHNADENEDIAGQICRLTGHPTQVMDFPINVPLTFNSHAFATNAGLFLKDCKKRCKETQGTDQFFDVNMDILSGRFRNKHAKVPAWLAAVPVTAFVIAMAGWTVNAAYTESTGELEALRWEAERLNRTLVQVKQEESHQKELLKQIESTSHAIESAIKEREALLGNQGLYVKNVNLVCDCLPAETFLTSLNLQGDIIRLNGVTDSPYKAVDYVQALESAGYLPKLEEIGAQDLRGFTFRITIDQINQ